MDKLLYLSGQELEDFIEEIVSHQITPIYGYFLSSTATHGTIRYSGRYGKSVNSYYTVPFCVGCTVQCEIAHIVNGVDCGVAFTIPPEEASVKLYPTFYVLDSGCKFEFVD